MDAVRPSTTSTLRLFVAIEVPISLRDALAQRCRGLRASGLQASFPKARWVGPDAMHLTLSFLGDTDREDLPNLHRELRAAFAPAASLELRFADVGAFPPRGKARVLWAGLADGGALIELQKDVAAAVELALDLEPETRPFHPHVTLARLKPPWSRSRADVFPDAFGEVPGAAFTVSHGTLFESELHPSGARYRVVGTYPLEGA